ncbi:MAG: DUF4358 domain-containing protein, partial [Oscillospiraceae bacterium]
MKHRNLALLLAGVLTLGLLAGCAPKDKPEVSPSPSVEVSPDATEAPDASVTPEVTASPDVTASPEVTVTPDVTVAPSEKPSEKPVATPKPSEKPVATPKPSEKPVATPKPSEKPVATPKPTEKPAAPAPVKVSDLWTKISDGLSDVLPSGIEPDGDTLDTLYGISTGDLEEYYFRMPMMSAHVTEFFIAKVKSGKMDTIKAA